MEESFLSVFETGLELLEIRRLRGEVQIKANRREVHKEWLTKTNKTTETKLMSVAESFERSPYASVDLTFRVYLEAAECNVDRYEDARVFVARHFQDTALAEQLLRIVRSNFSRKSRHKENSQDSFEDELDKEIHTLGRIFWCIDAPSIEKIRERVFQSPGGKYDRELQEYEPGV